MTSYPDNNGQPRVPPSENPSLRPDGQRAKPSRSSPQLPDLDLPVSELDLTTTFDSILSEPQSNPEVQVIQKRASNVLKLTQENDKLQAELRAMTERLEAAERKQRELSQKITRIQEEHNAPPS